MGDSGLLRYCAIVAIVTWCFDVLERLRQSAYAERVAPQTGYRRIEANKKPALRRVLGFGSPGWIRTTECLSQSQVPYRLATGLYKLLRSW